MMAGCWPIPLTASHLFDIKAFPLVTIPGAQHTCSDRLRLEKSPAILSIRPITIWRWSRHVDFSPQPLVKRDVLASSCGKVFQCINVCVVFINTFRRFAFNENDDDGRKHVRSP